MSTVGQQLLCLQSSCYDFRVEVGAVAIFEPLHSSRKMRMKISLAPHFRSWSWSVAVVCALQLGWSTPGALAEPVPVRSLEGTLHGFLALRTESGRVLAVGDLFQTVRGDQVTARLIFRFKDGSVDDETAVYSQRGNFQLISNHHVQKGPFFPHPMDLSIDVGKGQVTVRSIGKDGKEEVTTEHLDLPPDLYNGLITTVAKNLSPDTPVTKIAMLVATPKPRLVKLAISPRGEESFSVQGSPRKAMRFEIKFELGGVAGLVAPLIGKQPPDIQIWILGGEVPAFVREEGPRYHGGPILSIQLTAPVWPRASRSSSSR